MENEMLKLIISRRSVRKYRTGQIPEEELSAVLEAGLYAPSGMGRQPVVLVAVQDKKTLAELARMNASVMGTGGNPYYEAPTVILALVPADCPTGDADAACALENMMLAAHSMGLGSCWINREKEMFASASGKKLLEAWGLPQALSGVGAISLGYPADSLPGPAPRKAGRIIRI